MILFEWYKFACRDGTRTIFYNLPFKANPDNVEDASVLAAMSKSLLCTKGMQIVMHITRYRMKTFKNVANTTGVIPPHANTGRKAHNAVSDIDERGLALKDHFEYLTNLGEVRATRSIATLVDGVGGHTNRTEAEDMIYLPISMGYQNCYRRYIASYGYDVKTGPDGKVTVVGEDGERVEPNEFVSFRTYIWKWQSDYPNLKVSKPVEDICPYCYVIAHRHKYLANHTHATMLQCDDDGTLTSITTGNDEGAGGA